MSNATRWYATRETVKREGGIKGPALDAVIDRLIESASTDVEEQLQHKFIPYLATRRYDYPPSRKSGDRYYVWPYGIFLDEDLLEATLVTKDGDTETTVPSSDYLLLPRNATPKTELEINLATDASLGSTSASIIGGTSTFQEAIRITGEWGKTRDTKPAGALVGAVLAGDATIATTDSSLIGIGDTLRIEDERLFVRGRQLVDTGANLAADVAGSDKAGSITLDDPTLVHEGEVLTIGAEKMLVDSIAGAVVAVERAFDGTQLATHATNDSVYAPRRLQVVRAVNGSTAAGHADAAAVLKYAPPGDIVQLVVANALMQHEFGKTGWSGRWAGGEASQEMRGTAVYFLCEAAKRKYLEGGVA